MNNFNNSNNFNGYNNNYNNSNNFNNYNKFNYYNPNNGGGYYPNNGFTPNGGQDYRQELYYKQQAKAQRKEIRSLGNIIGCCLFLFLAVQLVASLALSSNSALYQNIKVRLFFRIASARYLLNFLLLPFLSD